MQLTVSPFVYVTVQYGWWNEVTIPWIFPVVPPKSLTTRRVQNKQRLPSDEVTDEELAAGFTASEVGSLGGK